MIRNKTAKAIGENLHELRHLELIGNTMTNIGLEAILDGCCYLESLDLRQCMYINLKGDMGKRCSENIKYLKLPEDSVEGCLYISESDMFCVICEEEFTYYDDLHGIDGEDWTVYDCEDY
ncbi:unnamed protein product [Lactuca virosa]|uniref:Uncharacterized protein n=1 Tax=Lactuca virosa TaxID=75947 RepID=A0AAU9P5C0_9ASTR|nr:unnamed protein product [Lactuca virosa]